MHMEKESVSLMLKHDWAYLFPFSRWSCSSVAAVILASPAAAKENTSLLSAKPSESEGLSPFSQSCQLHERD